MSGCSTLIGLGVVVFLYVGGIMFAVAAIFESLPTQIVLAWLMLALPCTLAIIQGFREKKEKTKYYLFYLISGIIPIPVLIISTVMMIGYSSSCTDRLQPGGRLVSCNFSNADLRNLDLHGSDLSYATLRNADLQGAYLQDVNLEYADLEGANLTDAHLEGVRLSKTKLIDITGLPDEQLAEILNVSQLDLPLVLSNKTIWLESEEEIRNALADICRGKIVPGTANYNQDHAFHPLILLQNNGGYHQWTNDVRTLGWSPMAVRHAELVACVGEQEALLIQRCGYMGIGGGSYERYQYQVNIKLVATSTNEAIAETTLNGGKPLECPDAVASGSHGSDYGNKIYFEAVEEWLHSYVFTP